MKKKRKLEIKRLREMIEEDDKEIAMYSKLLKLNGKTGRSLYKAFEAEGLGDLLAFCDRTEESLARTIDRAEETVETKPRTKRMREYTVTQKARDATETAVEDVALKPKAKIAKTENSTAGIVAPSVADEPDPTEKAKAGPSTQRLNDSDLEVQKEKKIKMENLTKTLKGAINKISESNIVPICRQVEDLFLSVSKRDVKQIFTDLLFTFCSTPILLHNRLLVSIAVLVAVLHSKLKGEITSFLVEHFASRLEERRRAADGSEQDSYGLNNGYVFLGYLAALKVAGSNMIFEIAHALFGSFSIKDAEILLHLFRAHGFMLRKSSPVELKKLVITAQSKVKEVQTSARMQTLATLLMNDINNIKNNRASKLSNYDPELTEHATRVARSLIGGCPVEPPVAFGLQDVLDAPVKGRWWIVGSSFEVERFRQTNVGNKQEPRCADFRADLLLLARKNRMNTELRRHIFCTIMSSEDYLNAFQNLLKLNLKDPQEREIIHILFVCCLNEKKYNPFYALVIQAFCKYHRRFVVTTQYAVWDKLKVLSALKKGRRHNFASLLANLLGSLSFPVTVFKAVDFTDIDSDVIKFLKLTFTALLLQYPDETLKQCFGRLRRNSALWLLRDGIRLFLQHFLIKEGHEGDAALNRKVLMIDEFLVPKESYCL
uniref:MI domain-containing protein n=1 Tax=Trichuris muris TaxID=70415 RepID=A0A5S6QLQ6_TRIMR